MKYDYHIQDGEIDAVVRYLRETFAPRWARNPTRSRKKIRAWVEEQIQNALGHLFRTEGFEELSIGGITVYAYSLSTADLPFVEIKLDPFIESHHD